MVLEIDARSMPASRLASATADAKSWPVNVRRTLSRSSKSMIIQLFLILERSSLSIRDVVVDSVTRCRPESSSRRWSTAPGLRRSGRRRRRSWPSPLRTAPQPLAASRHAAERGMSRRDEGLVALDRSIWPRSTTTIKSRYGVWSSIAQRKTPITSSSANSSPWCAATARVGTSIAICDLPYRARRARSRARPATPSARTMCVAGASGVNEECRRPRRPRPCRSPGRSRG